MWCNFSSVALQVTTAAVVVEAGEVVVAAAAAPGVVLEFYENWLT